MTWGGGEIASRRKCDVMSEIRMDRLVRGPAVEDGVYAQKNRKRNFECHLEGGGVVEVCIKQLDTTQNQLDFISMTLPGRS